MIKEFRYRALDTTIVTIGDVDADFVNDTIKTNIYEKKGVIIVRYVWEKGNELMWEYSFENPYFYIGNYTIFLKYTTKF